MQRLRRVLRLIRHAAFSFCCVMAVVCLGLTVATRWFAVSVGRIPRESYHPLTVIDRVDFGVGRGNANLTVWRTSMLVHKRAYPEADSHYTFAGWETGIHYLKAEWKDLTPIATTRAAWSQTNLARRTDFYPGALLIDRHWSVTVPLFALANAFALWPAIQVWRRWRARSCTWIRVQTCDMTGNPTETRVGRLNQ